MIGPRGVTFECHVISVIVAIEILILLLQNFFNHSKGGNEVGEDNKNLCFPL